MQADSYIQPYQFEPYAAENRSTDDSSDQEESVDCEHGCRLDCIEEPSSGEHFSFSTFLCLLFLLLLVLFCFVFHSGRRSGIL